jgi:hypothetical protein
VVLLCFARTRVTDRPGLPVPRAQSFLTRLHTAKAMSIRLPTTSMCIRAIRTPKTKVSLSVSFPSIYWGADRRQKVNATRDASRRFLKGHTGSPRAHNQSTQATRSARRTVNKLNSRGHKLLVHANFESTHTETQAERPKSAVDSTYELLLLVSKVQFSWHLDASKVAPGKGPQPTD